MKKVLSILILGIAATSLMLCLCACGEEEALVSITADAPGATEQTTDAWVTVLDGANKEIASASLQLAGGEIQFGLKPGEYSLVLADLPANPDGSVFIVADDTSFSVGEGDTELSFVITMEKTVLGELGSE